MGHLRILRFLLSHKLNTKLALKVGLSVKSFAHLIQHVICTSNAEQCRLCWERQECQPTHVRYYYCWSHPSFSQSSMMTEAMPLRWRCRFNYFYAMLSSLHHFANPCSSVETPRTKTTLVALGLVISMTCFSSASTHTYTHTHTHTHTYIHTYIHAYYYIMQIKHTYVHEYVRTHTHTHTHTHTQV